MEQLHRTEASFLGAAVTDLNLIRMYYVDAKASFRDVLVGMWGVVSTADRGRPHHSSNGTCSTATSHSRCQSILYAKTSNCSPGSESGQSHFRTTQTKHVQAKRLNRIVVLCATAAPWTQFSNMLFGSGFL